MEIDKKKLDAFVARLRKEQRCSKNEKPFFNFSRDVFHNDDPCYFCGFTGRVPGEGRYIYSPLAEIDDATDEEVQKAIILFCGKCFEKIENMEIMECDFE
jgi:hypothetical protein